VARPFPTEQLDVATAPDSIDSYLGPFTAPSTVASFALTNNRVAYFDDARPPAHPATSLVTRSTPLSLKHGSVAVGTTRHLGISAPNSAIFAGGPTTAFRGGDGVVVVYRHGHVRRYSARMQLVGAGRNWVVGNNGKNGNVLAIDLRHHRKVSITKKPHEVAYGGGSHVAILFGQSIRWESLANKRAITICHHCYKHQPVAYALPSLRTFGDWVSLNHRVWNARTGRSFTVTGIIDGLSPRGVLTSPLVGHGLGLTEVRLRRYTGGLKTLLPRQDFVQLPQGRGDLIAWIDGQGNLEADSIKALLRRNN
jgi:hypothetical protein